MKSLTTGVLALAITWGPLTVWAQTSSPAPKASKALAHRVAAAPQGQGDPRMLSLVYEPGAVVTVPVARGIETHIVLGPDEALQFQPATGKGSDCKKDSDTWCVSATGRDIFIKPRLGADMTNMSVVTNLRRYTFVFNVLPPARSAEAVLELSFEPPPLPPMPTLPLVAPAPRGLSAQALIDNRMRALPQVRNAEYSVAMGDSSEDIVPTMVYDDGTQTYFVFPNNRPVPTVFQSAPDQSEEMVNVRMQGDTLVADRVARRFLLRMGNSVVSIINERFDIDGRPPVNGTTVPGVSRVLRAEVAATEGQQ